MNCPKEDAVPEDAVAGWALVYPHLAYQDPVAAIAWLSKAFGFRERVRMEDEDGSFITAKLETPAGGLIMVTGHSDDWLRERVPGLPRQLAYPHLGHTISVMVADVDAHFQEAKAGGATILMEPADQPWGLRVYATLDLEGHQWEFVRQLRAVEPEEWGARRL
jgi:uncharacterized glyoxalase superfamily protein PhnB